MAKSSANVPHRGNRAVLAMASANIAFNCDLVNSWGCLTTGLRVDTALWTELAHAAEGAGFRLGTDTILGFAVGGLWSRFRPMRSNFADTELRLSPRRLAICPALWPLTQSFLTRATLATSHMGYCLTPEVRVLTISPRMTLSERKSRGSQRARSSRRRRHVAAVRVQGFLE